MFTPSIEQKVLQLLKKLFSIKGYYLRIRVVREIFVPPENNVDLRIR